MLIDKRKSYRSGQSVVEVIVAVSIFVIIAASSVITILGSFMTSRLAEEQTQASFYASEGIGAVSSIRDQNWSNLIDGNYGLTASGGQWAFAGTSDLLGKFTRSVQISSVARDASGNIVDIGGTTDTNTKKITANITWNFVPSRLSSISTTTYLTNWQEVYPFTTPTPGATPTPTSTPTPTLTPTPAYASCSAFCAAHGYTTGTCRRNISQCTQNGEVNLSAGNQYCTVAPNNTCCCK